jgi:hypothetical protein
VVFWFNLFTPTLGIWPFNEEAMKEKVVRKNHHSTSTVPNQSNVIPSNMLISPFQSIDPATTHSSSAAAAAALTNNGQPPLVQPTNHPGSLSVSDNHVVVASDGLNASALMSSIAPSTLDRDGSVVMDSTSCIAPQPCPLNLDYPVSAPNRTHCRLEVEPTRPRSTSIDPCNVIFSSNHSHPAQNLSCSSAERLCDDSYRSCSKHS